MTSIVFTATGADAHAEVNGKLTAGMVGVTVQFQLDRAWEGLNIIATFEGSGALISVPLLSYMEGAVPLNVQAYRVIDTDVPWEVLQKANTRLRIGLEGRLNDGTIVIPTVWARAGYIEAGALATGEEANQPTPGIYDQIMAAIEAGKLQGEPGDDGVSPTVSVTEIEGGHRVSITDVNGTKVFDVMDGKDGSGASVSIVDNLGSSDPNAALSARMGGVLKTKIEDDVSALNEQLQPQIKQRVKTVNGVAPDENGNVVVQGGGGGSGEPGADGFSPIANVTQTASGAVISVTDKSGTTTATVFNGKDGKDGYTPVKGVDYFDGAPGKDGNPGADGYTPVKGKDYFDGKDGQDGSPGKDGSDGVSATHSWNGTVLTVTSASGTSSADLKGATGNPGKDGSNGQPGADGVSPTVAVSKSGKVTTVAITDKNGTKTATINDGADGSPGSAGKDGTSVTVKSVSESTADGGSNVVTFSDGKTLTVKNGKTGAAGKDGADGADGVSPSVTVSKSGKVTTIKITDATGTKTATINDGADGKDGANGSATIADGSITPEKTSFIVCEGSGENVTTRVPNFTNRADPKSSDWKTDTRFSSSKGTMSAQAGAIVTNAISCVAGDIVRIKGIKGGTGTTANALFQIVGYTDAAGTTKTSSTGLLVEKTTAQSGNGISEIVQVADGVTTWTAYTYCSGGAAVQSVGFNGAVSFRVAGVPVTTVDDIIITVNEPITYTEVTSGGKTYTLSEDIIVPRANGLKSGAKWFALGDSITQGYVSAVDSAASSGYKQYLNTVESERWVNIVAEKNGYELTNYGVGGTGYAHSSNNVRKQVATIDFSKCDFVTLAYGVNDWKGKATLGSMEDDVDTVDAFVPNMRYAIKKILTDNPYCKIFVITPLNCRSLGYYDTNWGIGYANADNASGPGLEQIFQLEKAVCEYHGIELIDMTHCSIINRENIKTMLPDYVHPTVKCHAVMARELAKKIAFQ